MFAQYVTVYDMLSVEMYMTLTLTFILGQGQMLCPISGTALVCANTRHARHYRRYRQIIAMGPILKKVHWHFVIEI